MTEGPLGKGVGPGGFSKETLLDLLIFLKIKHCLYGT